MNLRQNVTDYIQSATEEQAEILETLRQLIHTSVEDVTEDIKWGFPVFAKTKDFAYIRFSKKHITLGFYHPERIEDTYNLLEGSGTVMKHIRTKKKEDIDSTLFAEWFRIISK